MLFEIEGLIEEVQPSSGFSEAGERDGLRLGFFLNLDQRLEPDLAMMIKAGARRDDVPHDDVFLEPTQVIHAGASGSLGEDTGGVLEGSGAEEALGFERGLGDAEQDRLGLGRLAAHALDALVLFLEFKFVHLLAPEERGVARLGDAHLSQHLADDDFDVLVVNGDTLEPIDFLDFIDQVLLEFLRTADVENLVGINRAFGQLLALFDIIALEDDDVLADRDEVFLFHAGLLVLDEDAALATNAGAEIHDAVDLGDFGCVLRTAGLEEFGHTRQTARDVLGLGGLARGLGHKRAGDDIVAFGHDDMRAGRDRVIGGGLAGVVEDDDLRVQILFVLDNDHGLLTGGFVGLLLHGDALDDVDELHLAGFLGEDRDVVGVPLHEGRRPS